MLIRFPHVQKQNAEVKNASLKDAVAVLNPSVVVKPTAEALDVKWKAARGHPKAAGFVGVTEAAKSVKYKAVPKEHNVKGCAINMEEFESVSVLIVKRKIVAMGFVLPMAEADGATSSAVDEPYAKAIYAAPICSKNNKEPMLVLVVIQIQQLRNHNILLTS